MTASTLVVALTSPKYRSQQAVADMVRASRRRDFDVVQVAPDEQPAIGTSDISVRYRRLTPLSTNSDRVIDLLDTEGGPIRRRAAGLLRRRLRPVAQKLDQAIWPFTTSTERSRVITELETLLGAYDRAYLICTDASAMPQAIELAQNLSFNGSGNIELFHMISENTGVRQEEST